MNVPTKPKLIGYFKKDGLNYGFYECSCGTIFESLKYNVEGINPKTRSCGCYRRSLLATAKHRTKTKGMRRASRYCYLDGVYMKDAQANKLLEKYPNFCSNIRAGRIENPFKNRLVLV